MATSGNDSLSFERRRSTCSALSIMVPDEYRGKKELGQRGGSVASRNRSKAAHGISQIAADANARPSRTGN